MFGSIPKDTMAELLLFLSENEKFSSLKDLGTISPRQFRNSLKDLAEHLRQEDLMAREAAEGLTKNLKKDFQNLLGELTSNERERLLRGFAG